MKFQTAIIGDNRFFGICRFIIANYRRLQFRFDYEIVNGDNWR